MTRPRDTTARRSGTSSSLIRLGRPVLRGGPPWFGIQEKRSSIPVDSLHIRIAICEIDRKLPSRLSR